MLTPRRFHSCGVVDRGVDGKEVVIAGGEHDATGADLDVVEIYNIDKNRWRTAGMCHSTELHGSSFFNPFFAANTLPSILYSSTQIRYNSTFLLIGGRRNCIAEWRH